MTRTLALLSVLFCCAFGASALAGRANAEGGHHALAALLSTSAQGGPRLRAAVARAVEENPALAKAVSARASAMGSGEQHAVGAGLADADRYFAKLGSGDARQAQRLIESAAPAAAPGILAGYALAGGNGAGQVIPDVGDGMQGRAKCVSRAVRHHRRHWHHFRCHF